METMQQLGSERLLPTPYIPDLEPCDYYIFGPLKEDLGSRRLTFDGKVKEAVQSWILEQPKNFFFQGMKKLVERYSKYTNLQVDYVEK